MEKYFDCHCHVFTRKETINFRFLFQVMSVLPHLIKDSRKFVLFEDLKARGLKIKHFVNFMKMGMHESVDLYDHMQTVYNNEFNIVPLMFDLEYAFVSTRRGSEQEHALMMKSFREQFDLHAGTFNEGNKEFAGDALKKINSSAHDSFPKDAMSEFNDFHENITDAEKLLYEINNKDQDPTTGKKPNFEIQYDDICDLKDKYKESVFPFFAIDPRRPGIIDRFKNEIFPANIFSGVKLYTPNGYSPLDDDLMNPVHGLYAFCSAHNIPVTAHCAYEGFATPLEEIEIFGYYYKKSDKDPKIGTLEAIHGNVRFSKMFTRGWVGERADKLNHPDLWEKVLQQFPDLKLNLAHFGYPNPDWNDLLFSMMHKYPNLYTDLSCWTDVGLLKEFKSKYFLKASVDVKSRMMYGSDFYLDLIFIGSFQEYFKNFTELFSPDEFSQIARDNVKKFLFAKSTAELRKHNKILRFFSKLFQFKKKLVREIS